MENVYYHPVVEKAPTPGPLSPHPAAEQAPTPVPFEERELTK
jgi:hypothetical protein